MSPSADLGLIRVQAVLVLTACVGLHVVWWRLDTPVTFHQWLPRLVLVFFAAGAGAAMAILYLDVVNIAETSLHMHMLLRVAWGETTFLPALIEQYSPEHMVEERLQRLTGLGQVRREGDGFFVRDHSVLRIAAGIDIWKRVLKLPTSPDEAGA